MDGSAMKGSKLYVEIYSYNGKDYTTQVLRASIRKNQVIFSLYRNTVTRTHIHTFSLSTSLHSVSTN